MMMTNHSPRHTWRLAILLPGGIYGLLAGGFATVLILSVQVLYLRAPFFVILGYIGLGILSVAAGILSSLTSGSFLSAVLAGGVVAISIFITVIIYLLYNLFIVNVVINHAVWPDLFLIFAVAPFLTSLGSGWLGCYLYKKL